MGDWRLEIYDRSNSTRQAVIPKSEVKSGTRVEELNGQDTLMFTMDRGSQHWDTINLRDFVRLVDLGDNTHRSFRVRNIKDSRKGDVLSGVVQCEHLKYDMGTEIYTRWKPYVQADPSSIIGDILGFSSFSISTVSPATLMDTVLNFSTVLESLEGVRRQLDTDMFVNEDSTIKFGAHGNSNNVKIRYAKNMRGIERLRDVNTFFNKLYPFGAGEPPTSIGGLNKAAIQGAEHIVETINGATIGLHDRMVVSNDSLNDLWAEVTRANTLAAIGERKRILDSIANDSIVLATMFSATLIVGDYLKIISNATGDEVDFVKDQVSINTNGTIGERMPLNDIAGIHNLLINPALDGTFINTANGQTCEGWDESGTPDSVSKETSDNRVRYGSSAQSVSAPADSGVEQSLTLVDATLFSISVWVYISSSTGDVRIEFFDGTTTQPSGGDEAKTSVRNAWVQIMIEGVLANGTAGVVKILADDGSTQFIFDGAVMENLSRLTSPNQFTKISGARTLWDRGVDRLREQTAPRKQYVVGVADLFEGDRKKYQFDQFEIGDTVIVQDDELGIDVSARVRRKEWDIFNPWDAKIQIDNFADNLGKSLREQQGMITREEKLAGITSGRYSQERAIAGDDVQRITSRVDQIQD